MSTETDPILTTLLVLHYLCRSWLENSSREFPTRFSHDSSPPVACDGVQPVVIENLAVSTGETVFEATSDGLFAGIVGLQHFFVKMMI